MPWTEDDPPKCALHWTAEEKRKCVAAANAVLAETGKDDEAIFACIHAAGKSHHEASMSSGLTSTDRKNMDPELFAFPRTKQCPMPDEKHTRLAWDMIDNTKGVTDEERRTARGRVLKRARELGMDTKSWQKIKAMSFTASSLSAMSLEVPDVEDHPNRAPFSGVLTRVDQSSDLAPNGSYGRKIFIPSAVAEAALPSLLGMAIDFTKLLDGHDKKQKIGVITAATLDGSAVRISGFFYANDFPEEVSMIQRDKEDLGFSFEAERILVAGLDQDPIRIESMVFTGAAVLQKKKAAYHSTSLAASAQEKAMEKDQLDQILAAIGGLGTRLTVLEENDKKRIEASSVADKVAEHAKKLHDVANGMEAAGIGCDATSGHAHILHHMADSMMAEAHRGSIPSSYRGASMYGSARLEAAGVVDENTKKQIETLSASVATLTGELASSKTKIKDLEAKAASGAPERKTLPSRITSLMAKGNFSLGDDGKTTISKLDVALKGTSLTPVERIELKTALERAGLLTHG